MLKRNLVIIAVIALLFTVILTSCTKVLYVDKETNDIVAPLKTEDFFDLRLVTTYIYVDLKSDVLYYRNKGVDNLTLVPLMKPDGTCLTYTEWKANR